MVITAYKLAEDGHHIPKHFDLVTTLTGSVRGEITVETPIVRIEAPNADFNYIYIPDFKRYYYVLDKAHVRTGIVDLVCKVDVLQSHYKEIIKCPMIAERSDSTYNPFIKDESRVYEQRMQHEYVHIGDFDPKTSIIMTVCGS